MLRCVATALVLLCLSSIGIASVHAQSSTRSPREVVVEFVERLERGDFAGACELVDGDSHAFGRCEEDVEAAREGLRGVRVGEETKSGTTAVVATTLADGTVGEASLRLEDGEWRLRLYVEDERGLARSEAQTAVRTALFTAYAYASNRAGRYRGLDARELHRRTLSLSSRKPTVLKPGSRAIANRILVTSGTHVRPTRAPSRSLTLCSISKADRWYCARAGSLGADARFASGTGTLTDRRLARASWKRDW